MHVWRAALDVPESQVRSLWDTLTADERQRAEHYVFEKDRTHFVVARGLLRVLLGRYLRQDPPHLRFTYGPHGKPALATDTGGGALRFNVSHSHGLALYAITRGREVGVDVERIRPEVAQEKIAERFFSPREVTLLRALPAPLQATAFFACWTRKEAYIKATGEGLTLPLDQFDVSLLPGEPPRSCAPPGTHRKRCAGLCKTWRQRPATERQSRSLAMTGVSPAGMGRRHIWTSPTLHTWPAMEVPAKLAG